MPDAKEREINTAYSVIHHFMLQEAKDFTFNGHWKTCKRCSKTRYEGYRIMGEYHWYEGPQFGGGYLGKQTDCVWHDTIVNGKLDLW